MEQNQILKYPVTTEKCLKLMESENKIVFIVDRKARKQEIKQAIETMFAVKVYQVNTLIGREGKKAYIKLMKESKAMDIATKLGMI